MITLVQTLEAPERRALSTPDLLCTKLSA